MKNHYSTQDGQETGKAGKRREGVKNQRYSDPDTLRNAIFWFLKCLSVQWTWQSRLTVTALHFCIGWKFFTYLWETIPSGGKYRPCLPAGPPSLPPFPSKSSFSHSPCWGLKTPHCKLACGKVDVNMARSIDLHLHRWQGAEAWPSPCTQFTNAQSQSQLSSEVTSAQSTAWLKPLQSSIVKSIKPRTSQLPDLRYKEPGNNGYYKLPSLGIICYIASSK